MVPSFSGFPRSSCFFLLLPALLARCFWPVDFISCTDRMPEPRFIEAASNVPFFTAVSRFSPSRCILGDFSCKTCPYFRVSGQTFHRILRRIHFSTGRVCVLCRSPPVKLHLKNRTKGPPKSKLPAVCLLWYKHTTGREYLPEFSIARFCVQSIISADFWQFYRRFSGKRREWPKFFRRSPACGRCRPAG